MSLDKLRGPSHLSDYVYSYDFDVRISSYTFYAKSKYTCSWCDEFQGFDDDLLHFLPCG